MLQATKDTLNKVQESKGATYAGLGIAIIASILTIFQAPEYAALIPTKYQVFIPLLGTILTAIGKPLGKKD